MVKQNELQIAVEETGLEQTKVETLMNSFGKYFQEAKTIAQEARAIVVTKEDQTELMQQAKEKRLRLRDIRGEADRTRKNLKEQSLREGNAIQGAFNIIKALIIPVEEHLEKQEKYAILKEEARLEKRFSERAMNLAKYNIDYAIYNFRDMTDEEFEYLLASVKTQYENRKEVEKTAELERVKAEEKLRKQQAEIQLENEALKKERDEQESKLKKENEKRLQAEAKINKLKEAKEREKRQEETAQRKASLAPDKEKLLQLADVIKSVQMPVMKSKEATEITVLVQGLLDKVAVFIHSKSENL